MKISTWNINSINARIDHLIKFIKTDQSDIYLLQELKSIVENFPKIQIENLGYHCYVNGQKAWNGVAILSKKELPIINTKIPNYNDENARFLETEITLSKIENALEIIREYNHHKQQIVKDFFTFIKNFKQDLYFN